MYSLNTINELEKHLSMVKEIVELQEKRNNNFFNTTQTWVDQLEHLLKTLNINSFGRISAMKSLLISVDRNVIPEQINIDGRITKKKVKDASASFVIDKITEFVFKLIQKDIERINEAENISYKVFSLSKIKGYIKENETRDSKEIWELIVKDEDLIQGVLNLKTLIAEKDALTILDRFITKAI